MIEHCKYCGEPYEAVTICFVEGEFCAVCMERAMKKALKKHTGYGMINDYLVNREALWLYMRMRRGGHVK